MSNPTLSELFLCRAPSPWQSRTDREGLPTFASWVQTGNLQSIR